jgi:hypothetical protein
MVAEAMMLSTSPIADGNMVMQAAPVAQGVGLPEVDSNNVTTTVESPMEGPTPITVTDAMP